MDADEAVNEAAARLTELLDGETDPRAGWMSLPKGDTRTVLAALVDLDRQRRALLTACDENERHIRENVPHLDPEGGSFSVRRIRRALGADKTRAREPSSLERLTECVELALESSCLRVELLQEIDDGQWVRYRPDPDDARLMSPTARLTRCLRSAGLLDEHQDDDEGET